MGRIQIPAIKLCVLSLMPPTDKGVKRVIAIHNPDTGAYCVLQMWENDDVLQIKSWHRAPDKYGNNKWNKN